MPPDDQNATTDDVIAEATGAEPAGVVGEDPAVAPNPDPAPGPEPAPDPEAAQGEAAQGSEQAEGARRRARRERAERRAAQARAEAIEQARREARRRARGRPAEEAEPVPRGAIRGVKMALAAVLAAAITAGLGLVLYFTPLMSVRDVEITGLDAVTREEVLDAANVRYGTPLLQVDTGAVADRVAAIRRVAVTRVQRQYPSTLGIAVTERIPVAVKDFPDGPHLFDRDGVDFATAPPPSALAYLDVDDPSPTDPATRAALEVMTALEPEVAGQVSRVSAPSVSSITLTLTDGRVVAWGGTDRTAEKAQKLAALLTQPGHVYDVSSPDLPTVK